MKNWTQWIKEWGTRSLGDILAVRLCRFLEGWKIKPTHPWPEELDEAVNSPESELLCSRCFTPQKGDAWFCPKCGAAVGPYNNTMPFLPIFSTGEVLRAGTGSKLKRTPLTTIGYVLVSSSEYLIFAPLYLYRFVRNWQRNKVVPDNEEGPPL